MFKLNSPVKISYENIPLVYLNTHLSHTDFPAEIVDILQNIRNFGKVHCLAETFETCVDTLQIVLRRYWGLYQSTYLERLWIISLIFSIKQRSAQILCISISILAIILSLPPIPIHPTSLEHPVTNYVQIDSSRPGCNIAAYTRKFSIDELSRQFPADVTQSGGQCWTR